VSPAEGTLFSSREKGEELEHRSGVYLCTRLFNSYNSKAPGDPRWDAAQAVVSGGCWYLAVMAADAVGALGSRLQGAVVGVAARTRTLLHEERERERVRSAGIKHRQGGNTVSEL